MDIIFQGVRATAQPGDFECQDVTADTGEQYNNCYLQDDAILEC